MTTLNMLLHQSQTHAKGIDPACPVCQRRASGEGIGMTYGELSNTKTTGFQTNHIIDDVVNNARFCSKNWKNEEISEYDRKFILCWCLREGVRSPFTGALVTK